MECAELGLSALHSSTSGVAGFICRPGVPKVLIAIRHSLYPRQDRTHARFQRCTFHHSRVDNFMATFNVIKFRSANSLFHLRYLPAEPLPALRLVLVRRLPLIKCEWLARWPSDEVTYDSPTGSLHIRNLPPDRLFPQPAHDCATSVAGCRGKTGHGGAPEARLRLWLRGPRKLTLPSWSYLGIERKPQPGAGWHG